jgi:hypothetical protein
MAKVVIAELDIDIQALLKTTSDLKKEIDKIKNSQKELVASGQASSEAFVENEAVLKTLTGAYSQNIKAIQESGKATAQQTDQTELLNLALTQEATSISEAREQNKLLNKLRNETNVTTAEGQAQLTALNAKLDQNNEFIKENADAYLKQKINVGNYTESIKEAFASLNPLNGGIQGFNERAQAAGGVLPLFSNGIKSATAGIYAMVKASLAFIATPIGAVIAAIVVVFALVQNAMKRSEDSTKKLTTAFGAITGIIQKVLKALEPLGEFLIDYIVFYFEMVGKVATAAFSAVQKGLSLLGFDKAAKGVENFSNGLEKAAKDGRDLAAAEAELEKAQRKSRLIQLQYQKDAEKLRQIRDDESKTTAERIKANDDLGKSLQKQLDEELKIAQLALKLANLRIAQEGKTKEALDGQAAAMTEIADIQERITGQESEQLVNRNSLLKEAADKQREAAEKAEEIAQKRIDDAISQQEAELSLLQERNRFNEDELKKQEIIAAKELEILKTKLKNKKISQTEFDTAELAIQNNLIEAKKTADEKAAAEKLSLAKAELDLFLATEKSKLEGAEELTNELIKEEELRLQQIEKKKLEQLANEKNVNAEIIENKKATNQALTQAEIEYETQRILLSGETDKTIQTNKKTLEERIKAEKAAQLEAQKEIDLANAQTQLEADLIANQQAYDAELAQLKKALEEKKITEDQFREKKRQADETQEEMDRLARINNTQSQLNEYAKLTAGLQGLFGKNKAIASATALINGGLAVTEILKTPSLLPEPIASISRAVQVAGVVGTTARSIAQINGAKFEKGGIQEIGGQRHSAGGTKFYGEDGTMFEAERGEGIGILNRGAYSAFMDFNNSFGSGKSGNGLFQGGGIITQGVKPQTTDMNQVIDAIANLPAPVVAVEEIQTVGQRYVNVKQNADF